MRDSPLPHCRHTKWYLLLFSKFIKLSHRLKSKKTGFAGDRQAFKGLASTHQNKTNQGLGVICERC